MFQEYQEYINTTQNGLVMFVEHNLKTLTPFVLLYEPVGLNDYKVVPLYDSRIASLESKGPNVFQVSFNTTFKGYIQFLKAQNVQVSLEERVSGLEDAMGSTVHQQKQLVSGSQWRQMNSLVENEMSQLKKTIDELNSELKRLKTTVAAL